MHKESMMRICNASRNYNGNMVYIQEIIMRIWHSRNYNGNMILIKKL